MAEMASFVENKCQRQKILIYYVKLAVQGKNYLHNAMYLI